MELKQLQSKMTSSKAQSMQESPAADQELRLCNNKQYLLNKDVVNKIDEALTAEDSEEHTRH